LHTNYRQGEILCECEISRGIPRISSGFDPNDGSSVIIKFWPTISNEIKLDLREIWKYEIKQLQRIASATNAHLYFASYKESFEDTDGFYIVYDTDQYYPLASISSEFSKKYSKNKILFWKNVLRIFKALKTLHDHKIIHRNIDEWSIFTQSSDNPDYILSGFEFSLRVNKVISDESPFAKKNKVFTFNDDWYDLGKLIKALINKDKVTPNDLDHELSSKEARLLSYLTKAKNDLPLNSNDIFKWTESIIRDFEIQQLKIKNDLALSINLPRNKDNFKLFEAYQNNSWNALDQVDAITIDLSDATLVRKLTSDNTGSFYLFGNEMMYELERFRFKGEPVNEVMSIRSFRPCNKFEFTHETIKTKTDARYTIYMDGMVNRDPTSFRSQYLNWNEILTPQRPQRSGSEDVWRPVALLQNIFAMLNASKIWPVEITKIERTDKGSVCSIVPSLDDDRDLFVQSLGMKSSAESLRDVLVGESRDVEGDWYFSKKGFLGTSKDDKRAGKWKLLETKQVGSSDETFVFLSEHSDLSGTKYFLKESDSIGSDGLLMRHSKLIGYLRNNEHLLRTLKDPQLTSTNASEIPFRKIEALDDSKNRRLDEILSVRPIYFLQGPPGVGKTKLIAEYARHLFSQDNSLQILLTAQNHETVDDLLNQISRKIDTNTFLLVRTEKSNPQNNRTNEYDLDKQTIKILDRFSKSDLYKTFPSELAERLYSNNEETKLTEERSLRDLLLKSSNIVLSTSNSKELEYFVEENHIFDEAVIEEAGRISLSEMIAPLLLSFKRVLIGDQNQLPPFDSERCLKLLKEPHKLLESIELAEKYCGKVFRDFEMPEWSSVDIFESVCHQAATYINVFKSMHDCEINKKKTSSSIITAGTLNIQHRMHPTLAELVSSLYEDYSTSETCLEAYRKRPPFYLKRDSRLNQSPITIIDMPFQQSTFDLTSEELPPNYRNPREAEAVIKLISLLHANSSEKPSLAILTPYRAQVDEIKQKLTESESFLRGNLNKFKKSNRQSFVSTIDGFQGNESDLVIASLVRNNHHASLAQSLGFMRDPRRLNVLVSRAKWKLIIVCSLEFISQKFEIINEDSESYNLKKLFSKILAMKDEKGENGNPKVTIVEYDSLTKL
jgi:hypothetical protein